MGQNRKCVASCHKCQSILPVPKIKSTLPQPVYGLFHTYSVDVAEVLPLTGNVNRFVIVGVEQFSG